MVEYKNKNVTKPVKVTVTRLEEIFEATNPCFVTKERIIKSYVYCDTKRIIA